MNVWDIDEDYDMEDIDDDYDMEDMVHVSSTLYIIFHSLILNNMAAEISFFLLLMYLIRLYCNRITDQLI